MRRLAGRHFVVVVRTAVIGRAVQRQQLATRPCQRSRKQVPGRKNLGQCLQDIQQYCPTDYDWKL
jgi:hypothetical protein